MSKQQKKNDVSAILKNFETIVNSGIDLDMDGDLFPHELIYRVMMVTMEQASAKALVGAIKNDSADALTVLADVTKELVTMDVSAERLTKASITMKKEMEDIKRKAVVTPTNKVGKYDN